MSSPIIPPSLQYVAELGDPVSVYKRGSLARVGEAFACLVLALLALGLAFWALTTYPRQYPKVAGENVPVMLVMAGVMLLGGLYWAWCIIARWNDAAVVYREGLAHFNGRRVRMFRWSEIESLAMEVVQMRYRGVIPMGTRRKYTIVDPLGGKLLLDGTLARVEELYDQVRAGAFPHIIARARQRFDAGEALQFGPFTIDKGQGIRKGRKSYAWGEISRIAVENGAVGVSPRKGGLFGGLSAPVAKVPNLDAFLVLALEMVKQSTPAR